jgi:hypothetical protein
MGLQVRMAWADCRLQPRVPGSQRSSQAACGDFRSDLEYCCEIIIDRILTNFSRCENAGARCRMFGWLGTFRHF